MSTALLVGSTACSSSDDKSGETPAPAGGSPAATSSSGQPTDQPTEELLADLTAANVVKAMAGAGYQCANDGVYAICTQGPVAVWVLTGDHERPPVVSLHSTGPAAAATANISTALPAVLEYAHINPRRPITEWMKQQEGKTTGQTAAGDWQVELSVEVDTDEPGAHLTLMDKLCKANCQAE
ncbi:hypothetical protein [Kribbella sp. VKM Ac-2568]|uniref:hypothetical protein n=1 Tax=Kribbella sp. VKM Ac-2568 TaxID=2512219 RepID=UPI00104F10AB|nr:hypothetical protein [Kribbella sp. VKM Ac-2568]TCM48068.1 hypothetical protein EV648_104463 [Kribbella sp. VKM Ac-2568]